MKQLIVMALICSVLAVPSVSFAATDQSTDAIIRSLQAQIEALMQQLELLKEPVKERQPKKKEEPKKLFDVTKISRGTVDGDEDVVLAVIEVTAKTRDLDGTTFTSESYVFNGSSPATMKHECRDTIRSGNSSFCKVLVSDLRPGRYKFVIKNPSIKTVGGGTIDMDILEEGRIRVR